MTQQCVNCPGAEDHSTAQCPVMAEASAVVNQQVTAADSLPVGVPDGYMPIPTAEQLADALESVRCFHDLGAELIAPELLANLLAVTSVKAEQVQCDPRDITGDTGRADVDAMIGRLTSADPDFNDCADAAALLRRLVMEEISGPVGYATWRDAAVAERVKRVAMRPNENIVHIARDGLDMYPGPNMNERKVCAEIVRLAEVYSTEQASSLPAAGSTVEEVPIAVLNAGWAALAKQGIDPEAIEMLPIYQAMSAALSAQQSEHVSVPGGLLERVESHLDRTTFAPFGEPLPPDNTERRELRDNIRALLNGGEA